MNIEKYRNNSLLQSSLTFPLKLTKVKKIESKERCINHISLIEDKIYGTCEPGYLFCVDLESGEIVWDKRREYWIDIPIFGDNEKIYFGSDEKLTCLNTSSGRTNWNHDNKGIVVGATAERLICRDVSEVTGSEEIFCLAKETGELLWNLKGGTHDYLDAVGVDDNKIVLKGGEGIHVCDHITGEVLWESKFQKLVDRVSPGSKFTSPTAFGPTVDGLFFLGFSQIGLLAAFKIETGEPVWTYDSKECRIPGTIIYHEGKLYFNLFQIHETDNYLTCVDAKTGECKFKTKENITPAGCKLPIITNNYFVTAVDNYISFFDLSKQEFVWRHKVKKSLFRTFVYRNMLISYNMFKKEIYWFESD
jgi:outer membrane protein assembly factor BamB